MSLLRSMLVAGAVTLAAVTLLAGLDRLGAHRRQLDAERAQHAAIAAMLPPSWRTQPLRFEALFTDTEGDAAQALALRGEDGRIRAYVTHGLAQGYGGELVVRLLSDAHGHPLRSRVLSHQETPAYVGDLGTRSAGIAGGAEEDEAVDQLSGASISARALAAALDDARTRARQLVAAQATDGSTR